MTEADVLTKIHEDLEMLKKGMAEIKQAIKSEPELREEVITQVAEARERISQGKFISNTDILKEFNVE